jgi:hypothetical protein
MSEKERIIKEFLQNILKCDLQNILVDEMFLDVKSAIGIKFKEVVKSEEIRSIIYKFAEKRMVQIEKEDKTLKEVLPKGFENNLKVLIYNKGPEIMEGIKGLINDDSFKKKVESEIKKFLASMNPMVSKFINVDNLYNKFMTATFSFIENPETMMTVVMAINKKIDDGSLKSISEFTNYIPYEGKVSILRTYVDAFLNILNEECFIKSIQEKIEIEILKYENIMQLLNSIGINEEKLIDKLLKSCLKYS